MQFLNSDHKSISSSSSKNKFFHLSNKWSNIEQNIDYIKSKRHSYLDKAFFEAETKLNDFEKTANEQFNVNIIFYFLTKCL